VGPGVDLDVVDKKRMPLFWPAIEPLSLGHPEMTQKNSGDNIIKNKPKFCTLH